MWWQAGNHGNLNITLIHLFISDDIQFSRSEQDSLLRAQIEAEEPLNLNVTRELVLKGNQFHYLIFYRLLSGLVINQFDPGQNHFGS
jgi:hypothetical protein